MSDIQKKIFSKIIDTVIAGVILAIILIPLNIFSQTPKELSNLKYKVESLEESTIRITECIEKNKEDTEKELEKLEQITKELEKTTVKLTVLLEKYGR
jgi:peptidoglycan hydrolase CwlO-like protein